MPPDNSRRTHLRSQPRSYVRPTVSDAHSVSRHPGQAAAASVVRSQLDSIFQKNAEAQQKAQEQARTEAETAFAETSHSSPDSPYDRTHEPGRTNIPADQWKRYHSAWQDYYRQYYERYYLGEIYKMRQSSAVQSPSVAPSAQTAATEAAEPQEEVPLEQGSSFHALRADLLRSVHDSATKARNSRHFMPLVAAAIIIVLLPILNYNRVFFANVEAYVSPGNINPANIIVDPNLDIPVSNEPRLIIPKINVDVPVIYDVTPDHAAQQRAMERGVAWFGIPGANSRPGQEGNAVFSGHSSNDLFDPGDYKFIFARLEQLVQGDTFYLNYEGTRYVYKITKKEVVKPTEVHKLIYDTEGKPVVTLITCVPLGTAQNRLLVTAEQISPNPAQAAEAPSAPETPASHSEAMPGNSPTLLGRLFGN